MANGFGRPGKKAEVEQVIVPIPEGKKISENLGKWFPQLPPGAISGFGDFHTELVKFNKTINLVSEASLYHTDTIHFGDSILACQMIEKNLVAGAPLYDFGSGNGFPGLVFATLFPKIKVIMVERDLRKAEFLKHMISILKVSNATVQASTVEGIAERSVKNAMARGFAPLHRALLICRKQFSAGGKFFHLKGDGWANELGAVPSQLFSFWSPSLLGQYKLPDNSAELSVVITEKILD